MYSIFDKRDGEKDKEKRSLKFLNAVVGVEATERNTFISLNEVVKRPVGEAAEHSYRYLC